VAIPERTLTDFLQHSGRLLPELREGEILLRRRDGEDLVLMTVSQRTALQTLARTFLTLTRADEPVAHTILYWLPLLAPADRQACLEELHGVAAAALESGRLGHLVEMLQAWEATALATWDAERNRERIGYEEDAPVELHRPGG
jgi:hypothetical protein